MTALLTPLVIGVGNRWRGDDGVGPRAIEALAHIEGLDAELLALDGEPARLVAAWQGRPVVVVVDAIVAGDPPGTVHVITDLDRLPDPAAGASSHGGGIAEAVALGRALGQLPDRLLVVGVEPATVGHGEMLSPSVAASVDAVVGLIAAEVAPCA
jgi:hydrogenase maturation protease